MIGALPNSVLITEHALANRLELSVLHLEKVSENLAQGNKLFKLLHWTDGHSKHRFGSNPTWVSWGGAFSNHLYALAQLGYQLKVPTVGLVRGPEPKALNHTLSTCRSLGMKLIFLDREAYRKSALEAKLPTSLFISNPVLIPEGGRSPEGVWGASFISTYIPKEYETLILSVGTGTTLAGILNQCPIGIKEIWALAPFKQPSFLFDDIKNLGLGNEAIKKIRLFSTAEAFGGFGKVKPKLFEYIQQTKTVQRLELDPIYTAKAFHFIEHLTEAQKPIGKTLFIHTGGLRPNGQY